MSHLMTSVDATNCTWTDLAIPILAGVNCAKHGGIYLTVIIKESMNKIQILTTCVHVATSSVTAQV